MEKAKQSFASSIYGAHSGNSQLKLYLKRDHISSCNRKKKFI